MLPVKLLVISRLSVVSFGGNKSYMWIFTKAGGRQAGSGPDPHVIQGSTEVIFGKENYGHLFHSVLFQLSKVNLLFL